MKKKLKKKIWMISTIILLTYITALILNPTALTALLPIIIPTGLLTVGLPAYAIIKQTKDSLEKIPEKPITLNTENNQLKNEKEKKETIANDNQINNVLEALSEQNIEDKPKIKTKGTIH